MDDEDNARRERSTRLHAEIDALRRSPRRPPRSPREFLEQRAEEERARREDDAPQARPEDE